MKKILIPIIMGMLCSPVAAEDIRQMMENMGYSEPSLFKHVPEKSFATRVPARVVKSHEYQKSDSHDRFDPDDLLYPRVFTRSEPSNMIPFLMKLQKKNPTSARITRKLAVTCLQNGQPREALYWYIQTYQRDRSYHEALWNMAAIAYQLGEMDQAAVYLEEYAKVDPHSAWGRMAREFLKGRFSGATLDEGFKAEFSKIGYTEEGNGNGDGILVIEGTRTTVEELFDPLQSNITPSTAIKKDTAKGKSGKPAAKTSKSRNSSLGKAKIVKPKADVKGGYQEVTAVAEPLGSTP
jgi:tetratricopeptide (TPR) repeat protein